MLYIRYPRLSYRQIWKFIVRTRSIGCVIFTPFPPWTRGTHTQHAHRCWQFFFSPEFRKKLSGAFSHGCALPSAAVLDRSLLHLPHIFTCVATLIITNTSPKEKKKKYKTVFIYTLHEGDNHLKSVGNTYIFRLGFFFFAIIYSALKKIQMIRFFFFFFFFVSPLWQHGQRLFMYSLSDSIRRSCVFSIGIAGVRSFDHSSGVKEKWWMEDWFRTSPFTCPTTCS